MPLASFINRFPTSPRMPLVKDDSVPASRTPLLGEPDGEPLKLSNGVTVQLRRVGDARVTTPELLDSVRGLLILPPADNATLAASGVQVHLLPTASLEDGLLGATTLERSKGVSTPTLVRVAVRAGRLGFQSTPEIVQHEVGHVLAVLRRADASEAAADFYARSH